MHFVDAKGILSADNGMNIYRGCTHGCIYCDSRSRCYGFTHPFEDIEVKRNAPALLEQKLRSKRRKCMIGTGAMCDPYLPCEEQLRLTRKCLELIRQYGYGAAVLTKSDRILRAMNRQYTADGYRQVVRAIRSAIPDVTFSTDVIVGFPGETEEDFLLTRDLMNEVGYDNSFIFKYSPRPGAKSAQVADSVPQEVKEKRNAILLDDLKTRVAASLRTQVGSVQEILVEGTSPRNSERWCGRTGTNRMVHFLPESGVKPGTLRQVRITRAGSVSLFGELL